MENTKASSLLGVTDGATASEVEAAFKQKSQKVAEKQDTAPTEALKKKFADLHAELELARAVLLGSAPPASDSSTPPNAVGTPAFRTSTPLTATKMADLPNAGPIGGEGERQLLSPGQLLANRYEVQEQIGAGGMGAVYRATDRNTGQPIALKVLLPSLTRNERARERFLDEARISQKLSHPNIVNVYDVQQDGELYFLTMELLEGQDLRQVMENRKLAHQQFTTKELLDLADQLCSALGYAHKHTVHRDLKPENVWLDDDGTYKLMDFGIAQLQSTSQRTQTGAAMGTAYYMAPEQLRGQKNIDGRADLYALAVLLYELASGDVPAGVIKPLREKCPSLPKGFAAAVMQCLQADPEERYDSAASFNTALQRQGGRLPAIPLKPIGLAAAAIVATVGIGWGVAASGVASGGSISAMWQSIKPVSKEEQAQRKASVARIQGEIKVLKDRLHNAQRQLASDVRDAERNKANDYEALLHWKQLTDNAIFNGSALTTLEGDYAMAETLLREGSFDAAEDAMSQVREGYENLWRQFTVAEGLHGAEQAFNAVAGRWREIKAQEQLGDPRAVKDGLASSKEAQQQQLSGDFVAAAKLWSSATESYKEVIPEAEDMAAASQAAREAKSRWQVLKKSYELEDPEAVALAEQYEGQAVGAGEAGDLSSALNHWREAKLGWNNAVDGTAGEVARIDKARAAQRRAEARRKAEVAEKYLGKFVDIPGESFLMGSNEGDGDEKPVHRVTVKPFKMMEHEVTWRAYQPCIDEGACPDNSSEGGDKGWGKGSRPVIEVSWDDITQHYIPWLKRKTGLDFRLPSEAEWEYAARAGSSTKYSWGETIGHNKANCVGCGSPWDEKQTAPVKSFAPNAFGLYDMHGNIVEWTQDCVSGNYHGAPSDGSAWEGGDCSVRIGRGGSWVFEPNHLRSADRGFDSVTYRGMYLGFRLVQAP